MRYRRFGRTGWNVSEIGYGMWGMAGWTGSDDKESLGSLQSAIDLGCNFFDTAWAYGNGHSEELLGKILRANKNSASAGGPDKKLYVATKVPQKNRSWPARPEFSLDESYPPDYIFEYVDRASKILGSLTLILFNFTTGKTPGSVMIGSCPPSKNCAAAERSAPLVSASTAGNPRTASAPCAPGSSTPSRSSTTSLTRIPRTNFFPRAARKTSLSSPVCPLTKARSQVRSRSTARGLRVIGAALTSSRRISKPVWSEPVPSNRFCLTA